jgi:alkylation response protein AidB-like acyl-CoA dehydrogenase
MYKAVELEKRFTSHDDHMEAVLRLADEFCDEYLQPEEVLRRDDAHQPPYDLIPALMERGFLKVALPASVGGYDLGWSAFCQVQTRLGRSAYFAASILNRILCFGIIPVMNYGTEQQKEKLLPEMLRGEALVALALNEPEAGSDARNVQTAAEAVDGGWKVNGEKVWISDANHSKYLFELCKADGAFVSLLIPRHTPGIQMTEMKKAGNNCMPTWHIQIENAFVPMEYQLGEVGSGLRNMLGTLRYSRASQAATATGCAEAALALTCAHTTTRVQFGEPLSKLQVVKHRLVDMEIEITKARLMVRELASLLDAGTECTAMSSMTKIVASETLQMITNHGMQLMASAGYSTASHMQRYWRDARLFTFGEGSNEIQKELIARTMGL